MEKKEPELIQNGLLLPAVLLDINNMDLLSEAVVEKAREATVDLVLRFQGLKDNEKEASSGEQTVSVSEMSDMDPETDKELRCHERAIKQCLCQLSELRQGRDGAQFSKPT